MGVNHYKQHIKTVTFHMYYAWGNEETKWDMLHCEEIHSFEKLLFACLFVGQLNHIKTILIRYCSQSN